MYIRESWDNPMSPCPCHNLNNLGLVGVTTITSRPSISSHYICASMSFTWLISVSRPSQSATRITCCVGKVHDTLNRCYFNVGPPSQTMAQYPTDIGLIGQGIKSTAIFFKIIHKMAICVFTWEPPCDQMLIRIRTRRKKGMVIMLEPIYIEEFSSLVQCKNVLLSRFTLKSNNCLMTIALTYIVWYFSILWLVVMLLTLTYLHICFVQAEIWT